MKFGQIQNMVARLAAIVAVWVIGSASANAQLKVEAPTTCPAYEVVLQMAHDGDSSAQLVVAKRYLRGTEPDAQSAVQ